MIYPDFKTATAMTARTLQYTAHKIHPDKWQGFDVADKPEAEMHEVINHSFGVQLIGEDLKDYQEAIQPNIPWVDDHFEERVGRRPVNPGDTWVDWPWANKADSSRCFDGKFSHTYMERYWPKDLLPTGYRFETGDLDDVVNLLAREPNTRQAYLPIFFPEDTGAKHGNRVPCTLGYHFIQRHGFLHIYYPIRSCDFYRHFRDDLYLTTRLLLWVLNELRGIDSKWDKVVPGVFTMWIGSLHLFRNDFIKLFGGES